MSASNDRFLMLLGKILFVSCKGRIMNLLVSPGHLKMTYYYCIDFQQGDQKIKIFKGIFASLKESTVQWERTQHKTLEKYE